ncbi:CBS domain-containing protein [Halanaeroarchaeum sulfurireducens]|nr:CBS domain-containing protein [Halanaeroarchaeum sulfurireducens]
MPIDDLARSEIVTATAETAVPEIASAMESEDVGSVVITDGDEPVGIVTDRDLALQIVAEGTDPASLTADDVMTTDIVTIDSNAGFYEAADRMAENGIRRLPVLAGDSLVGIITADDLTELLADEQQHMADIIRAQRPEY